MTLEISKASFLDLFSMRRLLYDKIMLQIHEYIHDDEQDDDDEKEVKSEKTEKNDEKNEGRPATFSPAITSPAITTAPIAPTIKLQLPLQTKQSLTEPTDTVDFINDDVSVETDLREGRVHWFLAQMYITGELSGNIATKDYSTTSSKCGDY
jgi:hypothetical protein